MNTKKIIRYSTIFIIFVLVTLAVLFKTGMIGKANSTPTAPKKANTPPGGAGAAPQEVFAKATVVKKSNMTDKIKVTGSVLPNEQVELTSEVGGIITAINFSEGMRVGQGSVLVRIQDAELHAQSERLDAQIKLYENREYRQQKLLEKGGVSQDEYDAVLAELNALKAQKKEVQAKIAKTIITAPFSGTVGLRKVSKGSYINPGTPIVSLVNLDQLKIEFSIPEKYMSKLSIGQTVNIRSEVSEDAFVGRIYAIEPRIDLTTRTITARAILNNPGNTIMPGAFVTIEIILKEYPDAVQIPSVAIIPELGGQKVFKYQGGKSVSVPVKTGIRTAGSVQITEGLSIGDTVITSGILNMRPNIDVKLTELN
ncbi:MAG: efflux RND transporter periplasmic adaptor subunit [Microscillaceae bacterium]|nr:efflux RND transporter periplasmic adaptor subunit [Microscillaceae bacterium]